MKISLVLPVHNEQDNLKPLYQEIKDVVESHQYDYEILFVDDGSTDNSLTLIEQLNQENPHVKGLSFRRNFGQTAAMACGIDHAKGDIIILMDADRQNDPNDIPKLLEKIKEGFDVVVGWRKERQDKTITRKLPSKLANALIRKVGGVQIHDLGCSLKAFRRDLIKQVKLYGEMHRFIPLYTTAVGGKICEVVVNHRPRIAGKTKYGLNRTFKVLLDLVTVKFLLAYATRPMYFFGSFSFLLMGAAFICSLFLIAHKIMHQISIIQSPLLILSAVLVILSVNFILMGLLAEMQMRTYFESQNRSSYHLKKTYGIGEA